MAPRHLLLPVATLLLAAGCGDTSSDQAAEAGGCKTAVDGEVTLVAQDLMWDTDCLEAPAGQLTIVVDNQDDGVAHDVHLPDPPDSPASDLGVGPSRQELTVTLQPGTYQFICDIHPNMVGTLTVTEANP